MTSIAARPLFDVGGVDDRLAAVFDAIKHHAFTRVAGFVCGDRQFAIRVVARRCNLLTASRAARRAKSQRLAAAQ
jgi:hypothetical protein